MINYGQPPAVDEIEITLFGPGYGEAIALHLGEGAWLLVDSCIDPQSKAPASATYLDKIGVYGNQVRSIVATHWHDDHVGGISKLANYYPESEFVISGVLNTNEAAAFLKAYSGTISSDLSRGTKELHRVISEREIVCPALHRSIVLEDRLNTRLVRVTALSPVSAAFAQFVAQLASFKVHEDEPINHVPELRPNTESVTLHIDLGDDAVLLGADLEEHSKLGWSAVTADPWSRSRRSATAYKVAHHGSYTGDCAKIWTDLLAPNPDACLTPYSLAGRRLPTETDKERLRKVTRHAYISSGASRRPKIDSDQLKRLGDMCKSVKLADAGFGAVRLRKQVGAPSWGVELFGAAQKL